MSLMTFWKSSRENVESMQLNQIVAIAGNGILKDGSDAATELREFLAVISTERLGQYLNECLEKSFPDSGLVLQDIVNELGSRLDCQIEHGRYRGKVGDIGFDGIWSYPNGYSIVVEVKTTDAYAIDLDKVAAYRKALISQNKITDNSSILIVVGRKDTGGLEAQVRGSRHAWDIRIISAEALLKLVLTKEDADNTTTIDKIRSLLIPQELTRLDFIVDLLATTADDLKSNVEDKAEDDEIEINKKKKFTPVAFNADVASKVGKHLHKELKKNTRSLYVSLEGDTAVLCPVSKAYEHPEKTFFWYAFHPYQKDALSTYQTAFIAFGCGSSDLILLFPIQWILDRLTDMNTTEKEDRMYWHVQFYKTADGKMYTNFKAGSQLHDVTSFLI